MCSMVIAPKYKLFYAIKMENSGMRSGQFLFDLPFTYLPPTFLLLS